ncbi:MAG: HDOD domain-containing protein [Comamonas sp.]
MALSALSSLTLGYRPLWNKDRALAGVQLYLDCDPALDPDVPHFLRILQEMWSQAAPPLLLSPQSHQLLSAFLEQAPAGSPWIEVRGDWLENSALYAQAQAAQARGLKLVWRGALGDLPDAGTAQWFASSLLRLDSAQPSGALLDGQMYEGLPSRTLLESCLDGHRAAAIAGWPTEDVLHQLRARAAQPCRKQVLALMQAIDAEQSLETFEDILGRDPVLAYRFMLYTNSAALGLRTGVDSLRRGLVMLGYGTLQRWLSDQLPHADIEPDLQPVRAAMVMRGHLTEQLVEAGMGHELQREVYLCGLFSQLDLLLGEPLAGSLRRLPLSERIYQAIIGRTGPYAPSLALAEALETPDGSAVRALCQKHEMDLENVNRNLLKMLRDAGTGKPTGR